MTLRTLLGTVLAAAVIPSPQADATVLRVPDDYRLIQAAVNAASLGDTVLVAPGTYYDCTHVCPDSMYACVILSSAIVLLGGGGSPSSVTINASHAGRVLYCDHAIGPVRIENLTLRNGYAIDRSKRGAGICCLESDLHLTNVRVNYSHANLRGGGIYGQDCSLTLVDCSFSHDSAYRRGGGIYGVGTTVDAVDCTFSECWATNLGGAVAIESYPGLSSFADCAFEDNESECGAGLFADQSPITITGGSFERNVADYHGGGMYCHDGSVARIWGALFRENRAEFDGGALAAFDSLNLQLSTLVLNGAGRWGAGIRVGDGCVADLEHSIVAYSEDGEAVSCGPHGEADLSCCDLYGNEGGDWSGPIAAQAGVHGNLCASPMFSDPGDGNFWLTEDSPCTAEHSVCGQMGAFGCDGHPGTAVAEAPAAGGRLTLEPAFPNPFNPVTTLRYQTPAGPPGDRCAIVIYDAAGRRVRTLWEGSPVPGSHIAQWDGTDDRGISVASGVYFCRLALGEEERLTKLVLLK